MVRLFKFPENFCWIFCKFNVYQIIILPDVCTGINLFVVELSLMYKLKVPLSSTFADPKWNIWNNYLQRMSKKMYWKKTEN